MRRPEIQLVSLGLNQDVSRAVLFPEAAGVYPFLASSSFWWLLAFLGYITPIAVSLITFHGLLYVCGGTPVFFLVRVHVIAFRVQ